MSIELHVLGAGCDVGRSCMLLTIETRRILLDCGAHPGFSDANRYPPFHELREIALEDIDAILISHSHYDHAGSLPLLTEKLSCAAPVYMTEPTKGFTELMLYNLISTSKLREEACPFGEGDVKNCLEKVKVLPLDQELTIGDKNDIKVRAFHAGHAIGAVMLYIEHAEKSVLYSGDYCTKSDGYLGAASIPFGLQPDLFITEATYCNVVRKAGRFQQEEEMIQAIVDTTKKGGKVLIPIPAFGKVQRICSVISSHSESTALQDVPFYISEGLASRANTQHKAYRDWTVNRNASCWNCERKAKGKKSSRFTDVCNHEFLFKLRPFDRNQHWSLIDGTGPMILFATPGNMSSGISCEVFKIWGSNPKNLVIVAGFLFSNRISSSLEPTDPRNNSNSTGIKCQVLNENSHVHADKRGILRMCKQIKPKAIALVHGEKQKILQFQKEVRAALNVPCYAPETGGSFRIANTVEGEADLSMTSRMDLSPEHSEEWKTIFNSYKEVTNAKDRLV